MHLKCDAGETLESSWDCKEFKLVNHKENNPEYSLKGLMLKLKLQDFCQLIGKNQNLMLGKMKVKGEGGSRR